MNEKERGGGGTIYKLERESWKFYSKGEFVFVHREGRKETSRFGDFEGGKERSKEIGRKKGRRGRAVSLSRGSSAPSITEDRASNGRRGCDWEIVEDFERGRSRVDAEGRRGSGSSFRNRG